MLWYALVFQLLNDIHCMAMPHFIHSSVDGHLGYFYFLALLNCATINICVQDFVHANVFILNC